MKRRKLLAAILSLTMVATMIPTFSFADVNDEASFDLATDEAIAEYFDTTTTDQEIDIVNANVGVVTSGGEVVATGTDAEVKIEKNDTTPAEIALKMVKEGDKLPYGTIGDEAGNFVAYTFKLPSEGKVLENNKVVGTTGTEITVVKNIANGTTGAEYVLYTGTDADAVTFAEVVVDFTGIELGTEAVHKHEYENWKTITEATCDKDGQKEGKCVCGETKTEPIPMLGHKWGDWTTKTAATYDKEGVQERVCSVCKVAETKAIAKLVKTDEGASSTPVVTLPAVGEKETIGVGKYKVTKSKEGSVEVAFTAPKSKSKTSVTIPATVKLEDGTTAKVTAISAKAFKNNKKVKKVKVGSNVKTIGKEAFSGAKKLTTVTLGKNVTTIGDKAFANCTAMKKITIPAKVSKIGKSAFSKNKKLKSITIKTKKLTSKKVGKQAFKGIASKATVKVPKGKVKSYKKILKKAGLPKNAKVK